MENALEPTISLLMMSIASSALTSLGQHSPSDQTENSIDKPMAKFNIDLLILLKKKTLNNLSTEEERLIDQLIHDLQLKFVQTK